MTSIEEVTPERLRERREQLLERAHMSWAKLRELADAYMLDADERNIYETIRSINYLLLADDDGE